MPKSLNVTEKDFVEEVLAYPGIVVVDFWSPGCAPCRAMAPIMDQLPDDVKAVKVNTAECVDICNHYNILTLPTLLIFKDGEVVEQSSGTHSKKAILELIDKNR